MNKKPSFLERLTGVLEEEEKKERMVSVNNKTANNNEEEEEIEEEDTIEEETEEETDDEEEENKRGRERERGRMAAENEKNKAKKAKKISLPPDQTSRPSNDWMPDSEGQLTIDVYQTPTEIVIKSTIAGVNPEDLDITITNDMVTIKGKREKDEVISEGDYYYQECYWGAFSRSVILPVDVEAEKAEAAMKNGILTLRLPKIEKVKTRKIRVMTS